MAYFLQDDLAFWETYSLEVQDPKDHDRVRAGWTWFDAQELAALTETRDGHAIKFRSTDMPWRAEFLPEKMVLTKGKTLPDFVGSFTGRETKNARSYLVSPALKDIIDDHKTELDGWNLFPVDILTKDGARFDTYYVWWVHKVLDAIDPTSKAITTVGGPVDGNHRWTFKAQQDPKELWVLENVIKGRQAWVDFRYYANTGLFVSDMLYDAMLEQGMTGMRVQRPFGVR